jgi:hypothetical protein
MPGILRKVIEHKLGIDPSYKSIKQKERRYTPERRETIRQEVNKLLETGFIKPVDYPNGLANLILVEKPDGSWRMCIDYTSLNKAYPKDEYPLPCICQIVDSTASYEMLSFLDAYSGYHQISLTIDDEETTVFIIPFGIFCYTKMAFRLKNRVAIYHKCIHIILQPQIGRNVEAYIDDVLVKSKKCGDLLDGLKETFDNLCKYKMMLNPKNMCSIYHQENCLAIWHKELPSVLWALCTNVNGETRDTPFNLVYGADALLPSEIYLESIRVAYFNAEDHTEARELDSNLLEERRNTTLANV